ncbi:MAG: class I SAM-dependent methyltransferase [Clostridia bacterium]|nr:class I SAM-dependent methyltransferase [Clostridia bacterium]
MELQATIVDYWNEGAKGYSGYIQDELKCFKAKAWTDIILEKFPQEKKLNILDVGTGPGFFSIILSKAGHSVTGIDCTKNMLEEARANAVEQGAFPSFLLMDSHSLKFHDNSFDLIVNRNVTWTLNNPEKAYKEWFRVLKKGGRLIIFDANWHLFYFDEELKKDVENSQDEYRKKFGEPFVSCRNRKTEEYAPKTPLANIHRPEWDLNALKNVGFSQIQAEEDVTERVYDEGEKLLYRDTPMFKIEAVK